MDTEFRKEVYEILVRHESKFDQIQHTLYTIRNELRSLRVFHKQSLFQKNINPPPPMLTTIHITPTNPPPRAFTTPTSLPPKRVQFHPIPPPTQFLTTTHITPHNTIKDPKIVKKKSVQLQVLQVTVCDLDWFQHWNLPTSSSATVSVVTIHLNTWTAVTLPTPKLPFPKLGGDFLTRWINNNKIELPADLFGIYPCGQG
ncbi:hypothetical protein Dsin_008491 [Dipteronia sinensis]|uniref:Uncharacterized protein n=1 Tax=Dipteronia sinensis TaxID=43782 RepID=A0AAE0EAU8_9ROSI|nr:hypothetical protein Dsin_008491 [Dipteronia sinensis]